MKNSARAAVMIEDRNKFVFMFLTLWTIKNISKTMVFEASKEVIEKINY